MKASNPIRIFIAISYPLVLKQIVNELVKNNHFIVIGFTESGVELRKTLKAKKVQFLLLDINLPDLNLKDLLEAENNCQVILYSVHAMISIPMAMSGITIGIIPPKSDEIQIKKYLERLLI